MSSMFNSSTIFKEKVSNYSVHVIILNVLAIFNVLDTADFCIFCTTYFVFFPNNFRNSSSMLLDHPPSTSMIILYWWTVYPRIVLVPPMVMDHTLLSSLHLSFLYFLSTGNSSPELLLPCFCGSISLHLFCWLAIHDSPHTLVCPTGLGHPLRCIPV